MLDQGRAYACDREAMRDTCKTGEFSSVWVVAYDEETEQRKLVAISDQRQSAVKPARMSAKVAQEIAALGSNRADRMCEDPTQAGCRKDITKRSEMSLCIASQVRCYLKQAHDCLHSTADLFPSVCHSTNLPAILLAKPSVGWRSLRVLGNP